MVVVVERERMHQSIEDPSREVIIILVLLPGVGLAEKYYRRRRMLLLPGVGLAGQYRGRRRMLSLAF